MPFTVGMESDTFEILAFQSAFLTVAEEIKLRRKLDEENEIKLQEFHAEKFNLERELEKCQKANEESHTNSKLEVGEYKRAMTATLMQYIDEQAGNKLIIEALEQENKLLKSELSKLDLEKRLFEKKTRELDGKLAFQENLQQEVLSQAMNIAKATEEVQMKCQHLSESQKQIEQHVEEVKVLNDTLQYEFLQQLQRIKYLEKDNNTLKAEIVELRSLNTINKAEKQLMKGSECKLLEKLQLDLLEATQASQQLQAQKEDIHAQLMEMTTALHEAHELLKTRVDKENNLSQIIIGLQAELESWKNKYQQVHETLDKPKEAQMESTGAENILQENSERALHSSGGKCAEEPVSVLDIANLD